MDLVEHCSNLQKPVWWLAGFLIGKQFFHVSVGYYSLKIGDSIDNVIKLVED